MNTKDTKQTDNSTILPYQRPVFNQLCEVARACLYTDSSQFKVLSPRRNFWLIGPSGSGKTFLSEAVAKEVGVPILSISVSDWILLGCGGNRGGTNTWPLIVEFITQNINERGVIVFLDEVDKCNADSEYSSFLRTEIFSVCDGRVPCNVKSSSENHSDDVLSDDMIADVEHFLKNKTMIIGGSAFQTLWDDLSAPSMGFYSSEESTPEPEISDLTSTLPRELVNRFSSRMFILPQISKQDYRDMITAIAVHIDDKWRESFVSIGLSNLDKAVRDQKGARYAEETLLSALLEVGADHSQSPPKKEVESLSELEFKSDDDELQIF